MKIIGERKINDIACKIIEIKDEDKKIKLWIDMVDFIIHKKEYYDKKSKLYKSIECSNLITQGKIKFYKNIKTTYLKKKTTADLLVNVFEITDFKDSKIFEAPKE